MPRFVVLLRGVNVGKGNRLPMADFKSLLESLGHDEVKTLLNSGNAVFRASARSSGPVAAAIHTALLSELGLDVLVVVKSDREFAAILEENPLARDCTDPSRLLVTMTADAASLAALDGIAASVRPPEKFVRGKSAAYLHCTRGILESAAATALLGKVGRGATTRNWATMLKLQALLAGETPAKTTPRGRKP